MYAEPSVEFTPARLLNVSWVANGTLDFAPGSSTSYSSTNFVLLGVLLASLSDVSAWDDLNQGDVFEVLPRTRPPPHSVATASQVLCGEGVSFGC